MKNKLSLIIVILGITFLFLSISLSTKVFNQVHSTIPIGVDTNNYVSFYQKDLDNGVFSKLSDEIGKKIRNLPFVESVAIYSYSEFDVGITEDKLSKEIVAFVNEDFFQTFGLIPAFGSYSKNSNNITITYGFALKLSKEPHELIGKSININAKPYIIDGIWPKDYLGIGNNDSIYLSAEIYQETLKNRFENQPQKWQKKLLSSRTNKNIFAKVNNGIDFNEFNKKYVKELSTSKNELTFIRESGEEVYFSFNNQNNITTTEGIVLKPNDKGKLLNILEPVQWIIALVFISTVFSYIYYQMSQLPAINTALNIKVLCGASISSVFFEFFIRSIFPLLLGLLLSIPLVDIVFEALIQIDLFQSFFSYGLESNHMDIYFGIAIAILISAVSSSVNTYFTFQKMTLNSGSKVTKSKIEVVSEKIALLTLLTFGVCATFITSILILDQYLFSKLDRGYETKDLYTITLKKRDNGADYGQVLSLFNNKSDISISPYNSLMPFDELDKTVLHVGKLSKNSDIYFVGNNFFDVTKIRILKGNAFNETSPSGVVVSESILSKLNLNVNDAIGKQVYVEVFGGAKMPQIIKAVSQSLPESNGEVYLNSFNPDSFLLEQENFLVRSNLRSSLLESSIKSSLDSIGWDLRYFSHIGDKISEVNESKNSLILLSKILTIGLMTLVISTISIYVRHDLIANIDVRKIKSILGANFSTLLLELIRKYNYLVGLSALLGFLFIILAKQYIYDYLNLEYITINGYISIFFTSMFVIGILTFLIVILLALHEQRDHKYFEYHS